MNSHLKITSLKIETSTKGVDVKNVTLNLTAIADIFPSGDYKGYGRIEIGIDILAHGTVYATVFSTNKDTFG